MPNGSIKHVHVSAHALTSTFGSTEFVGAITDVTQQNRQRRIAGKTNESFAASSTPYHS
jgi:hypothetical protein